MKTFLLAVLLAFFPLVASAQSRLAVLDIEGDLSEKVRKQISDEVRSGILEQLGSLDHTILTRENMLTVLRDMGKDLSCISEGECEIDIARNLGVDYVITGQIIRVEGIYLLSLKLHQVDSVSLTGAIRVEGNKELDLIRKTSQKTKELILQGFPVKKSPSKEEATKDAHRWPICPNWKEAC